MGLDGVELIARVEQEFRISFSDDEAIAISTVGNFCDAIFRKVSSTDADDIYQRVCAILADEFGVSRQTIQPTARLVEDLGLD
jgi:acyl carrier protein